MLDVPSMEGLGLCIGCIHSFGIVRQEVEQLAASCVKVLLLSVRCRVWHEWSTVLRHVLTEHFRRRVATWCCSGPAMAHELSAENPQIVSMSVDRSCAQALQVQLGQEVLEDPDRAL